MLYKTSALLIPRQRAECLLCGLTWWRCSIRRQFVLSLATLKIISCYKKLKRTVSDKNNAYSSSSSRPNQRWLEMLHCCWLSLLAMKRCAQVWLVTAPTWFDGCWSWPSWTHAKHRWVFEARFWHIGLSFYFILFLLMLCFFMFFYVFFMYFLQFQENAAIALARLAKGHEVRVLFFACGATQSSGTWLIFVSHVYSCCSTSYGTSAESRFCFIVQNKTTFGEKKKKNGRKKMRYLIDFAILVRTTPKKVLYNWTKKHKIMSLAAATQALPYVDTDLDLPGMREQVDRCQQHSCCATTCCDWRACSCPLTVSLFSGAAND